MVAQLVDDIGIGLVMGGVVSLIGKLLTIVLMGYMIILIMILVLILMNVILHFQELAMLEMDIVAVVAN